MSTQDQPAAPGTDATPVSELSYTEASKELDTIVEFFEQREVDVDQLVARLERASAIVDELDLRIRRTRSQVEELVPKLEAASRLAADDDASVAEDDLEEELEVWDDEGGSDASTAPGRGEPGRGEAEGDQPLF
ncbi:MAG: hypothetical protein ACYDD6_12420 [Acidimicrobiales bacterium]